MNKVILITYNGKSLSESEITELAKTVAPRVNKQCNVVIRDVSDDKIGELLSTQNSPIRFSNNIYNKLQESTMCVINGIGDLRTIGSVEFVIKVLRCNDKTALAGLNWIIENYDDNVPILRDFGYDRDIIKVLKRTL